VSGGRGRSSLSHQPGGHLLVSLEAGQEELDRHALVEHDVRRLDHGTHAADSQDGPQSVLAVEDHAGRKAALGAQELAGRRAGAEVIRGRFGAVLTLDHEAILYHRPA